MANQYVNKVSLSNGTDLIDLTDTTASAADVASGKYVYLASGERVAGSLSFITCHTGTTDPASSLGANGDIYLKVVS